MNKALFLDLDHTLIRPRSFGSAEFAIPLEASDAVEAEAYAKAEKRIPKDATEVESYEDFTDDDKLKVVGYKFRNVFPQSPTDWEFMPGIVQAVRPYIVEEGFLPIIISNQGGIEAGFHSTAEVAGKISSVLAALHAALNHYCISNFYICPSMKADDYDRKPNPGMIYRAEKHQHLDLKGSLFVGDMETDRQCAEKAGVSYMNVQDFIKYHG